MNGELICTTYQEVLGDPNRNSHSQLILSIRIQKVYLAKPVFF